MSASILDKRGDPTAFRIAVREWLVQHVPANWKARMQGATPQAFEAFQRWWVEQLCRAGIATSHWPSQWGGADLGIAQQIILQEEFARADAPDPEMFVVSLYHLPATLFAHGTAQQRDFYLDGVREGRDVWCQGFSEPGAGSDLAALRTRAERRGDAYVINGQKIWSSYGMFARYCLLLARTDTGARKQAGISYFIVDMQTPGITVRPIRQITGEAEFAELFFDDVEVPAENLIGLENEGWRIAQSTLSAERGLIVFNLVERLARAFAEDMAAGRDSWMRDAEHAREAARLHVRIRAVRLMIRRMLAEIEADPHGGGAEITTYIKLQWATTLQACQAFLVRVSGLDGVVLQAAVPGGGLSTGLRMNDFLKSYAWTIAGGTNEVIRNLIAERLLGLPKG